MKKGKLLVMVLTILAVSCLLGGCSQSSDPTPPPPVETTGSIKVVNNHLLYIIDWAGVFDDRGNKLYETANRENIDIGGSKTFSRINPGIYYVQVVDETGTNYQTSTVTTVRAGEVSTVTFTARGLANN